MDHGFHRPIQNTLSLIRSILNIGFSEKSKFLIIPLGNGRFSIVDGNHRCYVLLTLPKYEDITVACDILKQETPPDVLEKLSSLYNSMNAMNVETTEFAALHHILCIMVTNGLLFEKKKLKEIIL